MKSTIIEQIAQTDVLLPALIAEGLSANDAASRSARLAGAAIHEGDWLSIDGEAGTLHLGRGKVVIDRPQADLAEIERWRSKVA